MQHRWFDMLPSQDALVCDMLYDDVPMGKRRLRRRGKHQERMDANMQMTEEQRTEAPIEVVWRGLASSAILCACISGYQSLKMIGENRFGAAATVKIAPISACFGSEVQLSEPHPLRSYRTTGGGSSGVAGAAKASAPDLPVKADQESMLHYEVDAEVNDRLARLGGKRIDTTVKQLAAVFFVHSSAEVADSALGNTPRKNEAQPQMLAGMQPAVAQTVPAFASQTPAPIKVEGSIAWRIGASLALLLALSTLGRATTGWESSAILAWLAIGLPGLFSARAGLGFGFGFGFRRQAPTSARLLVIQRAKRAAHLCRRYAHYALSASLPRQHRLLDDPRCRRTPSRGKGGGAGATDLKVAAVA